MLNKINSRILDLEVPGIRLFSNQVVQYDDGIDLTI